MSNGQLSIQHLSWWHLTISAICQLLLTRFWPNLSQLSGTIFNRCQLSQWHLLRQHLNWRHLSISAISQLLWNQFWPKVGFLSYFCPLDFGLVWASLVLYGFIVNFLGPTFFEPNFLGTQFFGNKNFLGSQFFLEPTFFGAKILWITFLLQPNYNS